MRNETHAPGAFLHGLGATAIRDGSPRLRIAVLDRANRISYRDETLANPENGGVTMLNYDPDAKPQLPEGLLERAAELRLQVVQIICDEPNAQVGDQQGVSFYAAVPCVPRVGERIGLEDGTSCDVKRVYHKVVTVRNHNGNADFITLSPNVYAVRISKRSSKRGRLGYIPNE